MNEFQLLKEEVDRGIEGRNSGIPMGFNRLNKYIGIRKRIYTLVFAPTSTGKSAFVDSAYILNPFDFCISKRNTEGAKVKIMLFSEERSKIYKVAKWVSRKIFLDHGVLIPLQKLLGWWERKINRDEYRYFEMYEDYVNTLLEVVDVIEGPQNPTAIYRYVKDYAESHGSVEKIDDYHKIYHPNDPNEIVIPIVDHMGLTRIERDMNKKEAIDKVSEYFQYFRDFYGYSPVAVSQVNRDLSNPIYSKMDSFEPTLDNTKETGRIAEDCDNAISIFEPLRYKTKHSSYSAEDMVNEETGERYFRSVSILKNSYGESDISIGMAFQGATGIFKELPKPKSMDTFNYQQIFDGSFFL